MSSFKISNLYRDENYIDCIELCLNVYELPHLYNYQVNEWLFEALLSYFKIPKENSKIHEIYELLLNLILLLGIKEESVKKKYLTRYDIPMDMDYHFIKELYYDDSSWLYRGRLEYPDNKKFYSKAKRLNELVKKISPLIYAAFYPLFKNKLSLEYIYNKEQITRVSDLESFSFCPASFSIKNTYKISETESMITGTKLHEEQLLKKFKLHNTFHNKFEAYSKGGFPNKKNPAFSSLFLSSSSIPDIFLDDIENSKLVSSGHELENENVFFYSNKKNLIGMPDYILENKRQEKFVVEEKFTSGKNSELHSNHLVQLLGYLYGAPGNINYGYLITWKYHYVNESPKGKKPMYIHWMLSVVIHRIEKNKKNKEIILETFNSLNRLKETGEINFNISQINANKCAKCNLMPICKHKTGNIDTLSFPYDPL